jgi:phenylalanyl-tRNA synthetase beta chain
VKITWNWLKEYLDFECSLENALQSLMRMGLEIDSVIKVSVDPSVVSAKIVACTPHPKISALKVCSVYDGKETFSVVCGASIVEVGKIVALAKPGATIAGKKIEVRTIGGVDSFGMLCSEKELQVGEDASALLYLENTDLGLSLNTMLEDTIMDLGITPNRGDCLSVRGLAREVAAAHGKKYRIRETRVPIDKDDSFSVHIEDKNACPFYGGAWVSSVKIQASPFWLRTRLHRVGLRPKNNVVDITNFILWDIGQPMHAFDLRKLQGKKITVRRGFPHEKIHTLDGQVWELSSEDLVIANFQGPVAIAGVLGGFDTAVDLKTDTVFFESASFHPTRIRKTARRLGLSSDSSYRFERGTDTHNIQHSLLLATQMTQEMAGGIVENSQIGLKKFAFSKPLLPLRLSYCNQRLGLSLQGKEMEEALSKLDIKTVGKEQWSIPSYRNDLNGEVDLVEEVARIYGYDRIPENTETISFARAEHPSPGYVLNTWVSEFLVGLGLCEAINYSFVAREDLLSIPPFLEVPEKPEILKNPLSPDQSVMRNSLLPGLLRNAINSRNYKLKNVQLFEVGSVFPGLTDANQDATQWSHLALVGSGELPSPFVGTPERFLDLFDMKGILEALFGFLRIEGLSFEPLKNDFFQHGLLIATPHQKNLGVFGQVSEKVVKSWGGKGTFFCVELSLEKIVTLLPPQKNYRAPIRFPSIVEDMSFIVDEKITHREIVSVMEALSISTLKTIQVFDIYQGKNIPADKKSMAYSLTYSDPDQTLKMETVHQLHEKIKQALVVKLNVEFR